MLIPTESSRARKKQPKLGEVLLNSLRHVPLFRVGARIMSQKFSQGAPHAGFIYALVWGIYKMVEVYGEL
jgi:hypothetical protein